MKKMAGRFYSADYVGLTGNIYEWSCDKNFVAAPFSNKRCSRDSLSAIRHDFVKYRKLFFKIASYRSRLNLSVTTSPLNGVQKLTFTVISSTKRKTGSTIFVWLFFLLDAGQLFHNFFFV
ncbi:hypothetical protein HKH36_001010 [Enterococcus faecium]|nr:hypothetical protein [Enterococcus faecium]